MFDIKNNVIKITKGDSAALSVILKQQNGTAYTMQTGDTLTFSAKKSINDENVQMQIVSTSNIIDFTPAKTKLLEVGEGYCDIQLTKASGDIFTVFAVKDRPNLIVYPEITE